jgi:cytochrome P450
MVRIGRQLLGDSKAAISASEKAGEKDTTATRRDLLSLLVRANTATDLADSQRMSDEDVLAREFLFIFYLVICAGLMVFNPGGRGSYCEYLHEIYMSHLTASRQFLVAGHETTRYDPTYLLPIHIPAHSSSTSTATTWALFALTQTPDVQTKLRSELLTISTDNPSMDELSALPYLDAVVRETLRIHSPVPSSVRVAMEDDVIPVNTPFVDKTGQTQHGIKYVIEYLLLW